MENQDENKKENQTIIINQQTNSSNSAGIAGLILSVISWFLFCFPIMGSIIWLLGAIFSIIGLFKRPRGAAIAGVIISFIGLIILIFAIVGIIGLAGLSEGFDINSLE